MGIGRTNQVSNVEFFGVNAPVDSGFGGMYINTQGSAGKPFYGYATEGGAKAWTEYNGSTGDWLLNNNGDRLVVQADGDVGLGVSSPNYKLDVNGKVNAAEGFRGSSTSHGVYIDQAGNNGVMVNNALDSGVLVTNAGLDGVIVLNSGSDGFESNSAGDNGVEVNDATGHGVQAETVSTGKYGGYFANIAGGGSGPGLYALGNTGSAPDLVLGANGGSGSGDDGIISSDPDQANSDIILQSNDKVIVDLDNDQNTDSEFLVRNGAGQHVFEVNETGDAKQPLAANGLVKAAAYVRCDGSNSSIIRSFNALADSVTISFFHTIPGEDGCIVDFNFDLSDRFWVANVVGLSSGYVNCHFFVGYPDELDCLIEDTSSIGDDTKYIMILVY